MAGYEDAEPLWGHLLDTYASEANKTVSLWLASTFARATSPIRSAPWWSGGFRLGE